MDLDGTADGIFATKRIQQISDSMKKPVYALFVDLTAAFDHVIRDWLFVSIYQRFPPNTNTRLVQLLEAIYKYTTTALAETPEEIFEILTGVRQGGPESPPLYNLYMDYIMRVFLHMCINEDIQFLSLKYRIRSTASTREERMYPYSGTYTVDWLGYAYDVELFFDSQMELQRALSLLHSCYQRFGLQINAAKTKTMIFNYRYIDVNITTYPTSITKLGDQNIENVKTFRYLGELIKFDEPSTGDSEIQLRISLAEVKFYELIKKLTNYNIYLKTRIIIFNTIVRSRLTYSCQTWNVTQAQMSKINSAYVGMLRKLVIY